MTNQRITLYIDLLFCLLFIPLVITLLPVERWLMHSVSCVVALVVYVYLLYFVYRKVHIPQLFLQKRYVTLLLLIVVLVGATTALTHIPFPLDITDSTPQQMEVRHNLKRQTFWFFFLIVSGFSLSVELAFELFRQILSKHEIESRKERAELALYKSQINPHFLFNTLNTLYALVICRSEHTETAFVKFSNLLRYMYSQISSDVIPIGREVEYISQYVDLQKLRLNQHTRVIWKTEIDDDKVPIPPMILITFVENAFKYGVSSEKDCVINIVLQLKAGLLRFETENEVMRHVENSETLAVGLENCRKRLQLIFGGLHQLLLNETNGKYHCLLTIQLR